MNRRDFLAASSAMAAVTAAGPAPAFAPSPLRALPRHRRIFVQQEDEFSWLFCSDAPAYPPKVVRYDVIERVFGAGTYDTLGQPDHWRMIAEGWFGGEDLHQPVPLGDWTYTIWKSFYHPVVEAHDLLRAAFGWRFGIVPSIGGGLRNGLVFAEHPSTPRYTTARAHSPWAVIGIALDLAGLDQSMDIVLPKELEEMLGSVRPHVAHARE